MSYNFDFSRKTLPGRNDLPVMTIPLKSIENRKLNGSVTNSDASLAGMLHKGANVKLAPSRIQSVPQLFRFQFGYRGNVDFLERSNASSARLSCFLASSSCLLAFSSFT